MSLFWDSPPSVIISGSCAAFETLHTLTRQKGFLHAAITKPYGKALKTSNASAQRQVGLNHWTTKALRSQGTS